MTCPTELRCIESAEARLGIRLPAAFRNHLLASNGGDVTVLELEWQVVPVGDDTTPERAHETTMDLVAVTAQAREWPGFPAAGVVAADDGCGNYLLFLPARDASNELAPTLHAWWHEGGELERVAPDFRAALDAG